MGETYVDVASFYGALDQQRQSKSLSWRQVAKAAGISPSTLTRMAQGKRPDVDSFAALVRWLGIPAEQFVRSDTLPAEGGEPEPLAVISTYLRASKDLSPQTVSALEDILQAAYRRLKEGDD